MDKEMMLNRMQGYKNTVPRIKNVLFDAGKIQITLQDGRIIISPLTNFPAIKRIPVSKRNDFSIINNGTALNIFACNEIFHIRDFLGLPENWADL